MAKDFLKEHVFQILLTVLGSLTLLIVASGLARVKDLEERVWNIETAGATVKIAVFDTKLEERTARMDAAIALLSSRIENIEKMLASLTAQLTQEAEHGRSGFFSGSERPGRR